VLAVQSEFLEREREVSRYFDFLRHFDAKQIAFDIPPTATTSLPAEETELFKTLKANGFLLLYNLVESTLKNAIEAIFEELRIKSVSFDACRVEVRQVILTNLRKHNVKKIVSSLSALSTDVVFATFQKEAVASGTVDGRFVRELSREFGFSSPSVKSDQLLTVKTNRNDLAHGLKSFAEVGRDFDLERLDNIRMEVVNFLNALLDNVANYLITKSYLAVI
jgi:MAE_28990/MAE_18760-like HEPN